jgi:hypothetical protein
MRLERALEAGKCVNAKVHIERGAAGKISGLRLVDGGGLRGGGSGGSGTACGGLRGGRGSGR